MPDNLKIRVMNEQESREVQGILFSVGKTHDDGSTDHHQFCFGKYPHFINCEDDYISASRTGYLNYDEITLAELRAMVHQEQGEPFLTPETTLNDQYAEIEQVRQQSIDATLAERGSRYGDFESVAGTTRALMLVLGDGDMFRELSASQYEALHMICSKMARIVNGDPDYRDNWHDIGGYAKLIENNI